MFWLHYTLRGLRSERGRVKFGHFFNREMTHVALRISFCLSNVFHNNTLAVKKTPHKTWHLKNVLINKLGNDTAYFILNMTISHEKLWLTI